MHRSVKASSASTRSRNQTAARLWFPLQTLQTPHRQLSALLPSSMSHQYPTHFSFLAHAVLHAHLAVSPHTCVPTSPFPYALADNDRFSLSDLFSLGSRPDRPAHCRHLTNRTGDQPALRVGRQNASGYPCEPASLLPAQNRRPPAPMQPTDGQPAPGPGQDPSASSASIRNQQTVSKHSSQRFTSKSRPDMQVGVEDTTQPMRAASHTVRDPAGPYTRRAHSASPDRLDGRCDSDGVEVTYQKTRDLSASVFLLQI